VTAVFTTGNTGMFNAIPYRECLSFTHMIYFVLLLGVLVKVTVPVVDGTSEPGFLLADVLDFLLFSAG
jgi:hypothetical protein